MTRLRRRGGFAAVTSIFLLGLAAMALTALASLTTLEARRTRADAQQAQLRQLLLAGTADIRARSAHWGDAAPKDEKWEVALPSDLSGDGASLNCHAAAAASGGEERVTIEAALDRAHASQILALRRDNDQWRVESAALQP